MSFDQGRSPRGMTTRSNTLSDAAEAVRRLQNMLLRCISWNTILNVISILLTTAFYIFKSLHLTNSGFYHFADVAVLATEAALQLLNLVVVIINLRIEQPARGCDAYDTAVLLLSILNCHVFARVAQIRHWEQTVAHVLPALAAVRFARVVPQFQVAIVALISALRAMACTLIFLGLVVYCGAVLARGLIQKRFPDDDLAHELFGTLSSGMLTLLTFATLEDFTDTLQHFAQGGFWGIVVTYSAIGFMFFCNMAILGIGGAVAHNKYKECVDQANKDHWKSIQALVKRLPEPTSEPITGYREIGIGSEWQLDDNTRGRFARLGISESKIKAAFKDHNVSVLGDRRRASEQLLVEHLYQSVKVNKDDEEILRSTVHRTRVHRDLACRLEKLESILLFQTEMFSNHMGVLENSLMHQLVSNRCEMTSMRQHGEHLLQEMQRQETNWANLAKLTDAADRNAANIRSELVLLHREIVTKFTEINWANLTKVTDAADRRDAIIRFELSSLQRDIRFAFDQIAHGRNAHQETGQWGGKPVQEITPSVSACTALPETYRQISSPSIVLPGPLNREPGLVAEKPKSVVYPCAAGQEIGFKSENRACACGQQDLRAAAGCQFDKEPALSNAGDENTLETGPLNPPDRESPLHGCDESSTAT